MGRDILNGHMSCGELNGNNDSEIICLDRLDGGFNGHCGEGVLGNANPRGSFFKALIQFG